MLWTIFMVLIVQDLQRLSARPSSSVKPKSRVPAGSWPRQTVSAPLARQAMPLTKYASMMHHHAYANHTEYR
jgi:hypothetical protein